jgi:beta-lactamase regulating signal transducer with metallopeptidase domain
LIAVVVAILVIPLAALPGWLPVPVSQVNQRTNPALVQLPGNSTADVFADVAGEKELALAVLPAPSEFDRPAAAVATEHASDEGVLLATTSKSAGFTEGESSGGAGGFGRIALGLYGLVAFAVLARLVVGHFCLMRLWRSAQPAPDSVQRQFNELAAEICPRAALRISPRAAGPVCFGVLRPRVLIPASLDDGDEQALRCIFAHELGHLRRRDPLAGWVLGLARAAYFIWPWLRGLRREVRLAQEHLADADAARRAASPAEYAELLIRMTRARPALLGAAGVRGTSSELYRRVTMLMKSTQDERRCSHRWAVLAGGGLTAFAILTAGLYVQPRPIVAGEPEKKEARKPDAIKELIEKLKKDASDDPEKKKQIEELEKSLKPKPVEEDEPVKPGKRLPVPPPIFPPGLINPDLPEDELLKQLMQEQEQMLRQLQQALGQLRPGGGGDIFRGPLAMRSVSGGRLGVRVEKPSDVLASQLDLPTGRGLVCVDVPAQSNAGKMGIKPHDILLEVGGKPVPNDVQAFITNLKDVKPDTAVDIVLLRKGKKETLKGVKIPEAKEVADSPLFPRLPGIEVIPLPMEPGVAIPPPIPPVPGRGGVGVVAGPGETIRVEQVNDAFTVFYSKDGIKVTITGSKEGDGPAKAESIEIDDNGKTTKAESVDKLPKEYQELAKSALKAIK